MVLRREPLDGVRAGRASPQFPMLRLIGERLHRLEIGEKDAVPLAGGGKQISPIVADIGAGLRDPLAKSAVIVGDREIEPASLAGVGLDAGCGRDMIQRMDEIVGDVGNNRLQFAQDGAVQDEFGGVRRTVRRRRSA